MHMYSAQEMALSMILNNTRIVITDTEYAIKWISPAVRYEQKDIENRLRRGYGIALNAEHSIEGYLYVGAMISGEYSENQIRFIQSILIAIIISFIAFVLLFYISIRISLKRMLKPLDALMQAAYGITQGNWATRLPDSEIYEFNTLTKAFSSMRIHMVQFEDLRAKTFQDLTHELKTPITIIDAEIEAIQAGINACNETALASIKEETERLNSRIDYILSNSKLQNPIEVHSSNVHLDYIFSRLRLRFKSYLLKNKVTMNINCKDEILIAADSEKLIEAFSNIINNALIHGGDALSLIAIDSVIDEQNVYISISNDGAGIPKKLAPFIFQRLFQHTEDGGSGIGLYIAHNIIQIHAGQLSLLQNRGGEVTFQIVLPIQSRGGHDEHI